MVVLVLEVFGFVLTIIVMCVYDTVTHVIDPKFPGAVDEIIHLGEYWNEEALKENRAEIVASTEHNGKIYKRVYKFLAAAKIIHDDIEWIYQEATNPLKTKEELSQFIKKIIKGTKKQEKLPLERHLFGSAYTYFGHIHHRETYLDDMKKIYCIKGSSVNNKSKALQEISNQYLNKGYDVDFYHEPLVPERLESVVIPELSIAVTSFEYEKAKKTIDLDEFLNSKILTQYVKELEISKSYFAELMDQVYENLKKTKKNHDYMETFYTPNIRFNEINVVIEALLMKITDQKKSL